MRGTKSYKKHLVKPDPKYNDLTVSKFINYLMQRGKKTVAQNIVYDALDSIKQKGKSNPVNIFKQAIEIISPSVEVKSRRIGGANYQIPIKVDERRQLNLACRWIIQAARNKKGKSMSQKLSEELLLAIDHQGAAFKKKEDVMRMAQANQAFAYFARFI